MLTLLSTEPGATIRPMGHTGIAAAFAVLGLFIGVPLGFIDTPSVTGWRRGVAIFGVVLSLTPFPLSALTLRLVANVTGFTLAE